MFLHFQPVHQSNGTNFRTTYYTNGGALPRHLNRAASQTAWRSRSRVKRGLDNLVMASTGDISTSPGVTSFLALYSLLAGLELNVQNLHCCSRLLDTKMMMFTTALDSKCGCGLQLLHAAIRVSQHVLAALVDIRMVAMTV